MQNPLMPTLSSCLRALCHRSLRVGAMVLLCVFAAGCDGSANAPPPLENTASTAIAPQITQQPVALSLTAGQPATFSVVATGTGPLAYQWQRNGMAIVGANSTAYTLASTVVADDGAVFRAVVSNVAGSATSNDVKLSVGTASPQLSITQQTADVAATAGASATFAVAATCSSGALTIQWQRAAADGFIDIAGATAATYTFTTVAGDNGAQFRANVSCGGQSAASSVATLTVSMPSAPTLRYLGEKTRDQAVIYPGAVVREPSGSYAFISGNTIRRLSADQLSITLLTGANELGAVDGGPTVASFNSPKGLTIDSAGNLYVADTNNYTIRKVTPDGTVSTIAGLANAGGTANGTGSAARFSTLAAVAMGPDGNLYVADQGNNKIRRVTPAGSVTDYAGSTLGFADGSAGTAQFSAPFGVAVAANGDVFVADTGNSVIRRISAAGVVTTFAGSGSTDTTRPHDGTGTEADIPNPNALAISGNTLYAYDSAGLIRAIDIPTALVTTFAGTPFAGSRLVDGLPGHAYLDNSQANGIAPTGDGGLMIGDRRALRITDATGRVRSIATDVFNSALITGSSTGVLAQLPFDLAVNRSNSLFVDATGGVIVADHDVEAIRRIDAAGNVTLLAGLPGSPEGVIDGVGNEAVFANVGDSVTAGPDGTVYASDNYGVRRIATDGTTTLFAGSSTEFGYVDGPAAVARFNTNHGMAVAPNGDVFVSDAANQTIRRVNGVTGATTTYAGAYNRTQTDGTLATAGFPSPGQLDTAPDGLLWVLDNGYLRHIALDGTVTTLMGIAFVRTFTLDTDGTIYLGTIDGLYSFPPGVTSGTLAPTLLIPAGEELTVSPDSPTTGPTIAAFALLGHKQVVMVTQSRLVVATLP